MGISFTDWNSVKACFMFAGHPHILMLLAAGTAALCLALILSIKKHEDAVFSKHTGPRTPD